MPIRFSPGVKRVAVQAMRRGAILSVMHTWEQTKVQKEGDCREGVGRVSRGCRDSTKLLRPTADPRETHESDYLY
ncbi:MAG: hypothetical protein MJZ89_04915 [Paludibacteraceae bacterium]|nr:hypothetical protein [Paludibacteraceae bacterium]